MNHSPLMLVEAAIPPVLVAGAAVADAVGVVSIHWDIVIVAAIAAIPATIASLAAYRQSKATHKLTEKLEIRVDGRLTELLELTQREATAQATLVEKTAEHRRKGDAAITKAKSE